MAKEIAKFGTRIPITKFHVSKSNVRAKEPFGKSEKDKILIEQISKGEIVQPFKARIEGNGYGVVVGRRRYLAKLAAGAKEFEVGKDVLLEEMDEDTARESSLIENLDILRDEMDPVTRAEELDTIVKREGLRQTARRMGISASTLSEWLQILNLSPKMLEALRNGLIFYTDALQVARMNLPRKDQEKLAIALQQEGMSGFKHTFAELTEGIMKRGLPKGKYAVLRTTFDRTKEDELAIFEGLEKLAKAENMEVDEYSKRVLSDHVKKAKV